MDIDNLDDINKKIKDNKKEFDVYNCINIAFAEYESLTKDKLKEYNDKLKKSLEWDGTEDLNGQVMEKSKIKKTNKRGIPVYISDNF